MNAILYLTVRGRGDIEVRIASRLLTGFLLFLFARFHRDACFTHRFHHGSFRDAPGRVQTKYQYR